MRILEQEKNRLVIELKPTGLKVLVYGLAILFLVLGFGMQYILPFIVRMMGMGQVVGFLPAGPVPGMSLLGIGAIIPLAIGVFLIKDRLLTFDRTVGQITINAKGLTGRSEKTYPMASFLGAQLASSYSSDSGRTQRAVLMFSDENGAVPLTPYSTSGSGPARTVNAINTWLGPVVQSGNVAVNLSGPEAAEAIAALEKLGIKITR